MLSRAHQDSIVHENALEGILRPLRCSQEHKPQEIRRLAALYAASGPNPSFTLLLAARALRARRLQGTLGGLVGTAPRFAQILEGASERSRICSNDPICADHRSDNRSGDRATHGAACHGCLLIAETSCEMRNLFLDRNLLVPTMSRPKTVDGRTEGGH
jgi:hypothetical protein